MFKFRFAIYCFFRMLSLNNLEFPMQIADSTLFKPLHDCIKLLTTVLEVCPCLVVPVFRWHPEI